ncbi:MAG TPA: SAM-dependent chlorinase/fluorinase [Chloroflexota bacterium]|nr:SAM-dependent chlorinase/fluorinase [Chloroflexota bacterium]
MTTRPIITFTTDFGTTDTYVAEMKGVILGITPDVTLVDISHDVWPQNIGQGAFLLRRAFNHFPAGTVHIAVVDPGVGTDRRPIAVRAGSWLFVAPDNGVLAPSLLALDLLDSSGRLHGAEGVVLANPAYRRNQVSGTFHGRDIFAPAAAYLASGVPLTELGPTIASVLTTALPEVVGVGVRVQGRVLHVDHFGNAITNLSLSDVPANPVFLVGRLRLHGISSSYQEADFAVLVGSSGQLEVAARNGSAARELGLSVGDSIEVLPS